MTAIISRPDTLKKLEILSADAQYDLACACSGKDDDKRVRGSEGKWIYPVSLPNGGKSVLFKTLMSNACGNDCRYCPLREDMDLRRVSLGPEETARVFMEYWRRGKVFGMFLSSGVCGSPDATMDRLNATAKILRAKHGFRGFIHLKVIPGASAGAIREAVSLASAVSLNIETPGAGKLAKLSGKKDFMRDIVEPIKMISRLTAKGERYARVKQTTQFIVGAAGESDAEIVKYMGGMYDRLKMHRIFFSAYQKGLGHEAMPGEQAEVQRAEDTFTREHRLYQVDFLLRKYGFKDEDIVYGEGGQLSLDADPKEVWAEAHPEFFPLDVNRARRKDLLRVPGLGPVTVRRIMKMRKEGKIGRIEDVGKVGKLLGKAEGFLRFD
ncbi:putative DNA modification/repair radical SAM protein [Anaerohalosphaera lusitana]|uniref:Putative DNA modification/repair radical SAM protein n=1 Tax=Anaerohalosphaera lusitana TaxID=1936003 RepID=A0A1U9NKS8_9BACT|nr:radical SAM protein [Anaerohalosphaera lusitana]AQT68407.1 putative DNA modification/repair radical SAM protein [Anaerohalosphaera lusitana]